MLLGSMGGWHTTCARAPALRRALKMPLPCIALSLRLSERPNTCAELDDQAKLEVIWARADASHPRMMPNRQLTHRTVQTQDFPDFWVLGGLRATRTLPVVGRSGT